MKARYTVYYYEGAYEDRNVYEKTENVHLEEAEAREIYKQFNIQMKEKGWIQYEIAGKLYKCGGNVWISNERAYDNQTKKWL